MKNLPMNFYPNLTEKFLVNSYIINKGISIKTQKYITKEHYLNEMIKEYNSMYDILNRVELFIAIGTDGINFLFPERLIEFDNQSNFVYELVNFYYDTRIHDEVLIGKIDEIESYLQNL